MVRSQSAGSMATLTDWLVPGFVFSCTRPVLDSVQLRNAAGSVGCVCVCVENHVTPTTRRDLVVGCSMKTARCFGDAVKVAICTKNSQLTRAPGAGHPALQEGRFTGS